MNRNLGILSGVGMFGTAVASVFGSEIKSFQDSQRKEWEKKEARKFKNKYASALLSAGDLTLWDRKGTLLRSPGPDRMPTHSTLQDVHHKRWNLSTEDLRVLHRKGCQDIYESSDRKYFDDLKDFCSKNNVEGISGTGINSSDSSEILKRIGVLGKHVDTKEISSEFVELWELVVKRPQSAETTQSHLVKVCEGQKKNIYMGEEDLTTKNIRSFCIEN